MIYTLTPDSELTHYKTPTSELTHYKTPTSELTHYKTPVSELTHYKSRQHILCLQRQNLLITNHQYKRKGIAITCCLIRGLSPTF